MAAVHSPIYVLSNRELPITLNLRLEIMQVNYDMKRSGAYIQNLRIQNGYSQNDLAKQMNINQSSLSRIEIGRKGCSVDLFIQFSELFHVSLDALILGMEPDVSQETERNVRLKADITELIDKLTLLKEQL